jgi:hypothetical protein
LVTKYRGKYRASNCGDSTALAKTGLVTGIYSDKATLGCARESRHSLTGQKMSTQSNISGAAAHFHCLENGKIYRGCGGRSSDMKAFPPTFSSKFSLPSIFSELVRHPRTKACSRHIECTLLLSDNNQDCNMLRNFSTTGK